LKTRHFRFAAVPMTFLLAIGCSRSSAPAAPAGAPAPPGPSAPAAPDAPAAPALVSGQASPGAIVALEPSEGELPMPEGPVILDQYSRAFVPDLLFVRVGQVVEFRNSEDVDHNIRVLRTPTGTTVMDVSGSQNQVFTHKFEQPGVYDVSCDVHPGMRGTIVVSRTPYITGTDERGGFTFQGVPAGRYTLKISSDGRETRQDLEVIAPRTDVRGVNR
jgi:plastocyanin